MSRSFLCFTSHPFIWFFILYVLQVLLYQSPTRCKTNTKTNSHQHRVADTQRGLRQVSNPLSCDFSEKFRKNLKTRGFFCQESHNYNPIKTKRRPLYLKTQSVTRCKTFHLGYKNQSVYAVSGTSRCLFSDKYKTHKYSVGRAYSC